MKLSTLPSSAVLVLLMACGMPSFIRSYNPALNHRALAGLWKLTQIQPDQPVQLPHPTPLYPMKEFTVYPKPATIQESREKQEVLTEVLLMLQEDGSFRQMISSDSNESDADRGVDKQIAAPDTLLYHGEAKQVEEGAISGTNWDGTAKTIQGQWDYIDGKLLLAADRGASLLSSEDTLLVGKVVATSGEAIKDQSILVEDENAEQETTKDVKDTHLSVPKGKVNVGKFMYPKTHPSFFEQPMFQPTRKGSFRLQQILGSLNTKSGHGDDEIVEKFKVSQFYNKTFLLTAHPLPEHKPKGELRWSIKYNKFVKDPPRNSRTKAEDEPLAKIRVMQIKFFANNTFATEAGMGSAAILRGKYDVIGQDRDHLWIQVWRFGFGRSVSGSVYSEGNALSSDDEKCYWGSISYEDEAEADVNNRGDDKAKSEGAMKLINYDDASTDEENDRRLFVKGSILFGYGLEPLPVGRFIMREVIEDFYDDDDGEYLGSDEIDEEATLEKLYQEGDDDSTDIDWSDSFQ